MALLIQFDGCQTCTLRETWPNLKTPKMPMCLAKEKSDVRVLVLGEAPGRDEDEIGIPFVGKTGKFLRSYIPKDWIDKVNFQNAVRCNPRSPDGRSNRPPSDPEMACCLTYLQQDILSLKPHVILGIGAEALNCFWPKATISKFRGIPFPIQIKGYSCWFYPCYHPSYVMRAQREIEGLTVNAVVPVFKNDIHNFFANIDTFLTPPKINIPQKSDIVYPQTKEEALDLFSRLEEPFAIDFETMELKPWMRSSKLLCAALSDGKLTFAFIIDWPGFDTYSWGLEVLTIIVRSMRRWIAQHAGMELSWIADKTKQYKHNFHDLEVVARLIHKRKGVGSLDVLSRLYLGIDIKQLTNRSLASQQLGALDKKRIGEYSPEQILQYCAIDAWSEAVLFYQLYNFLPQEQRDNYERTLSTLESIVAMEMIGLDVNRDEGAKLEKDLYAQAKVIEREAQLVPEVREYERKESHIFNLASPKIVGHVLTSYCGIKLPVDPETKKISTDSDFLEPLLGQHPLIDLILDHREAERQRGTYVEPILTGKVLGADGRLHASYTAVHTATYRLSSEFPNIQNFPKRKHKEVRRLVVPRKGFIFAAFDYGQLEARTLVMASKDRVLKQSFINHEDIHMKWLNRLLELYPPYLQRLALATGQTDPKKIILAGRDTIKTDFVFACFYGSVAKSVSDRAMIPMEIAKQILGEFWDTYRGVRKWIDAQFNYYRRTGTVQSLTERIRNEVLPGNEVINSPIQGTAAELVLEAQNALFYRAVNEDMNFMPRISIHDDLIFELPDGNDLEQYIKVIGDEAVKPRFPFVNLPLMSECRVGYNWCDLVPVMKIESKDWYD